MDANATRLEMRRVELAFVSNVSPMMMPQVVDAPTIHIVPQMLPTISMATPIVAAIDGLR